MYESPIRMIERDLESKLEGELLRVVRSVGFDVDRDELLKALQYDRDQYFKGYQDAKRDILTCRNCSHMRVDGSDIYCNIGCLSEISTEDFCSRAERWNEDENKT